MKLSFQKILNKTSFRYDKLDTQYTDLGIDRHSISPRIGFVLDFVACPGNLTFRHESVLFEIFLCMNENKEGE